MELDILDNWIVLTCWDSSWINDIDDIISLSEISLDHPIFIETGKIRVKCACQEGIYVLFVILLLNDAVWVEGLDDGLALFVILHREYRHVTHMFYLKVIYL